MRKVMMALALLMVPTQAGAQMVNVTVDIDRWDSLKKLAPMVCKAASKSPVGQSVKTMDSFGVTLTPDERLLMLTLCSLYIQGKIDALTEGK